MPEPWIDVEKVARHLDVAKGLPARRVGRLWKCKLSEINEWVRAGGSGRDDARRGEERN